MPRKENTGKKKKKKAYNTWYSQAVSHPSTNQARPCLASEIGRDRACSGWYGRKRMQLRHKPYLNMSKGLPFALRLLPRFKTLARTTMQFISLLCSFLRSLQANEPTQLLQRGSKSYNTSYGNTNQYGIMQCNQTGALPNQEKTFMLHIYFIGTTQTRTERERERERERE